MIRATLAGLGVALAAGPLGCFIVWRRMAFFGDATAHAAILGIALSLALGMSVFVGALVVAVIMALAVSNMSGRGIAMDTLLGVVSHSALALGLVAVSFLDDVRIDLMAYLFGDILAVGKADLAVIWIGAALVLAVVTMRWSGLLTSTISNDLGYSAGINPRREQMILTLCLAVVVAVAIKVVGILLIAAMLIIPAAASRPLARSPETMAVFAVIVGAVSAIVGVQVSALFDSPTGPTIVCVAAAQFLAATVFQRILRIAG